MGVKFAVNKESLDRPILPSGIYELEVMDFKPADSRKGDSTNINGRYQVIQVVGEEFNPELGAKKVQVFDSLNTSFGVGIQDFVHACGLPLEEDGSMPGEFDGPDGKLKYSGPLLGRRFKAELAVKEYQGKMQNAIKSYICAVPNCASVNPKTKHSTNLMGK